MKSINETLIERAATHGSFDDHSECSQMLKAIAHTGRRWESLSPMQREAVDMICHKIARILSGNPDHIDHWHDIAGYSSLVANKLNEG